ncbi:hypothetical protein Csa_015502 [Cucumis sativus]|uniref:Uncharacterized protein n=1 Tax=Cucumis sativus TaxID=3659 RepID=A0A0A0K4F2_CUCSA|nr:hypothetical protein Csa_015502 [Cucumis sativus]
MRVEKVKKEMLRQQVAKRREEKVKKVDSHCEVILREEEEDHDDEEKNTHYFCQYPQILQSGKMDLPFQRRSSELFEFPYPYVEVRETLCGVFDMRVDVVNLFYKSFIHDEENYTVVKQEHVYFGLDDINAFYGLDTNEVGQVIFKNSTPKDMDDGLKTITWLKTEWDNKPTEKYQLFSHNLNTCASIWLF